MQRSLLRVWLGTGVLTSIVLVGCNQGQRTTTGPLSTPPMIGQQPPPNQSLPAALPLALVAALAPGPTEPLPLLPSSVAGPLLPDAPEAMTTHEVQTTATVAKQEPGSLRRDPMVPEGSAKDYQTLTGNLEAGTEPGTWLLRYASPAQTDSHGGRLALVAPHPLVGLHTGQLVRVQGKVVENGLDTAYQVEQLWPVSER